MTNSAAHLQAALGDRYVLERESRRAGKGQARERAELYVGETTPLGFDAALKDGDPNADFSRRNCAKRLRFEG